MKTFAIEITGPGGEKYTLRGTSKGDAIPSDLQSVFEMRQRGDLRFSEIQTSHDEITALRTLGKLKSLVVLPDGRFQEVVNLSEGNESYWKPLLERKSSGGRNVMPFEKQLRGMVEEDRLYAQNLAHFSKMVAAERNHIQARERWYSFSSLLRCRLRMLREASRYFVRYILNML